MEPADSPGKYLKSERESRNLSLKEVSESTRIREVILRAIEEDKFEDLSPTYAKGFLSAYARCLGLDPNDIDLMHQKYAEALTVSRKPVLKHAPAFPKKRVDARLVISICAILFALFFIYASVKLVHRFFPSFQKKQEISAPLPPSAFSPPIRKETEVQTTDQPEKNQTQPTETSGKAAVSQQSVQPEAAESASHHSRERRSTKH